MHRPEWAPANVDIDRPSVARVYDYYLGGSHNFAADRELAAKIVELAPETVAVARANRAFLRRAVRFCVHAGIRQFLDIGSGIPTAGNVHDIAQSMNPAARVVYVDIDPVAVAHSEAILAGNELAGVLQADLRQPDKLINHPELRRLLDLSEPVALLMVSLLHFIPDEDDPHAIMATFRDVLAAGSHLVFSQVTSERLEQQKMAAARREYQRMATNLSMRSRAEISQLLAGWELVEPGLTFLSGWRPDSPEDADAADEPSVFLGGVGIKR